nr:MAG TPA: hypothetical protein [Caudoviricetes sp.]
MRCHDQICYTLTPTHTHVWVLYFSAKKQFHFINFEQAPDLYR